MVLKLFSLFSCVWKMQWRSVYHPVVGSSARTPQLIVRSSDTTHIWHKTFILFTSEWRPYLFVPGRWSEQKEREACETLSELWVNPKQTQCLQQVDQWRLVFIQFGSVVAAFETSLRGLWGNQVGQNEIYLNKTDFFFLKAVAACWQAVAPVIYKCSAAEKKEKQALALGEQWKLLHHNARHFESSK